MEPELSIGDVARETGLSVHALRFYEREGLMLSTEVARGSGGHRRYSELDVRWLGICTKLRKSGMPLAKIRRFAELNREGPGNEPELQDCLAIITRKVGVYEQHVADGSTRDPYSANA
jgi:DNA-binding transcriptional MerR regulator